MDPTKTRNLVTVVYDETRIDVNRAPILDISAAIEIPTGTTDITFALDVPAAEIHGAADPYGTNDWLLTKLTAAQIAGTSALPNSNFMSINKYADGSYAWQNISSITANVIGWTTSTVTVRFSNKYGQKMYAANNGSQIPFLRILGYPIRTQDAYQSARDPGSVTTRRERALTTEAVWVQDRATATEHAGRLVTALSRPRPELAVTVMGDPRRRPGQLVSIADAEGTAAEGTWRVLKVGHRGNGPMYVQDLQLTYVGPIGLWDEGLWDDAVWGE